MIFFEENDKCEFVNLVRYRNWIEQEKLVELYAELNRIILNNDSKKIGPLISCTHIVRKIGEKIKLDFEIMIPIDKVISLPVGFFMCDKFILENVLDVHIIASQSLIEEETEKVNIYIKENNILPKSAIYSILESEENGVIDTHFVFEK